MVLRYCDGYYFQSCLKGESYKKFLKIAFNYSDYFSVSTFKYVKTKELRDSYFSFLNSVQSYQVDTYSFKQISPHYERGQKTNIYILNDYTKKIIANATDDIYNWQLPALPEDLSFYKGKKAWFNSITHAGISEIVSNDCLLLKQLELFDLIPKL